MPESNDPFRNRLHRTSQGEAFGKRRSELQAAGDLALKTRAEYYRDQPPSSLARDARWVYDVIALDDVQPQDAPSSRAWGLLEWARRNRGDFYRSVVLAAAPIDEPVIQRQQKGTADLR